MGTVLHDLQSDDWDNSPLDVIKERIEFLFINAGRSTPNFPNPKEVPSKSSPDGIRQSASGFPAPGGSKCRDGIALALSLLLGNLADQPAKPNVGRPSKARCPIQVAQKVRKSVLLSRAGKYRAGARWRERHPGYWHKETVTARCVARSCLH
jgi:hypothetical protein